MSVRGFEAVATRLPVPAPPRFGPLVRGIPSRSLSRRSRALATGIAGVGLVVAFGMAIAVFTATYESAKAADSKFTVGSNLRVAPSPLSRQADPPSPQIFASRRRSCQASRTRSCAATSTATSRTSRRSTLPASARPRRSRTPTSQAGQGDGALTILRRLNPSEVLREP